MSITKSRDNRTGIVYVYESESYWDKELKAPRNHKKLIGRLDEETGEVVPTGKKGRKPKAENREGDAADYKALYEASEGRCAQKDQQILELRQELAEAKRELKQAAQTLEKIKSLLG